MKKKLAVIWRGIIAISRDMFTGFIMGLCAALVMSKINPALYKAVGLLIPAGIIAGVFKGTARFVFLSLSGFVPTSGSGYGFPRYKILSLWIVVLAAALFGVYGVNFGQWILGPVQLLEDNTVLSLLPPSYWKFIVLFISVTGLLAYIYEPSLPETKTAEPISNSDTK